MRQPNHPETAGVNEAGSSKPAGRGQYLLPGLIVAGLLAAAYALIHWIGDRADFAWSGAWWGAAYLVVGAVVGLIFGVVAFLSTWIWAANRYGVLGMLLGWAPASIAAIAGGYVLLVGWLPAIILAAVLTAR